MAVYSVLLAAGKSDESGGELVYTAPTSGVVVVRDVVLVLNGASAAFISLYAVSGSRQSYLVALSSPVRGVSYHWEGRQVLESGEELWLADGEAYVFFRVSGYLLGG